MTGGFCGSQVPASGIHPSCMPGSSQANGARYPTHPRSQVPSQPQAYRTQGYAMKHDGSGALAPHPGDM